MPTNKIEIEFKGDIKKFLNFLKYDRHIKILKEEVARGTARSCAMIIDEIEQKILKGKFKKNAPFTELMKGDNKPLIDTADMIRSLQTVLIDPFNAKAGFLKNTRTSHGSRLYPTIKKLEQGFMMRITPNMRNFMLAKMQEKGIALDPTAKGKGRIVVPARPFITPILKSVKVQKIVIGNWEKAIYKAYKRMGAL